jgi:two-component system CheB/CheR fusion protein
VPADSQLAYVVILHLSPNHDSQLAQVLQAVAHIPVAQVMERVRIEPNQHLLMEDDFIVPSPPCTWRSGGRPSTSFSAP